MSTSIVQSKVELQTQIDSVSSLGTSQLQDLFCAVGVYKDAAAIVYLYDIVKSKGVNASMWETLKRLEKDRGTTPSTFTVPIPMTRTLQPARRIHKICKGARLSDRNKDAASHIEAAKQWVVTSENVDARSSASARMKTAKALAKHLNIDLEVSRGLVTSLKRMKVL